jgi:hypothetical protein
MADEVRLIKQRIKPLLSLQQAAEQAVVDSQAAQAAAEFAQAAAEAAQAAALVSADNAALSEAASEASASASAASALASYGSEQLAMLWATAPYNQEVIVGSGLYSALHYATEALNIISGGFIDDSEVSTQKAYSSSKVLELHNAQAEAIKNLAGASASITNTDTPVFSLIPTVATQLPFTIVDASSDDTVFTIDDSANTITFVKNGSYNFLSTIQFSVTTGSPKVIRFELVDTATDTAVVTQEATIEISANDTTTLPLNTLVVVDAAPVTIKIMVTRVTDAGISLDRFYSILASSSGSGSGGATGGGADEVFYLNGQIVTADYSIPTGKNAMSAGVITIADGVTVTIPDNSTWTVV